MRQINRKKHSRVPSVLEKRALQYRNNIMNVDDILSKFKFDNIDETGTIETEGVMDTD